VKDNYQIRSVPRMFEQVANQIVDYITSERLEKGTKIPTERSLSELLEVSRSSVREGLRVLELLRYLDSKQGEGTFVSEPPPFLLPNLVLKSPIDGQQLKNYFEMAMVCAETILLQASSCNLMVPTKCTSAGEGRFSWPSFHHLIVSLGSKIDNTYFLSLWSDIYELLYNNHFFTSFQVQFDERIFLNAYHQQDEKMIREILLKIKNP
jgi:GntR family transcriptional regulator, transcriptional repressor for pyruvate dehydrogenase complex